MFINIPNDRNTQLFVTTVIVTSSGLQIELYYLKWITALYILSERSKDRAFKIGWPIFAARAAGLSLLVT